MSKEREIMKENKWEKKKKNIIEKGWKVINVVWLRGNRVKC